MELDLADLDGGNPYIHFTDSTPTSKYQNFPPEVQAAVINTYCEIVTREERLYPGTDSLEDLASALVHGFSKVIES
ncbi:hypothetical protein PXH59_04945 [Xenorhabdus sp. SF857]|uniref:hypothetical protein n=1 Tax=Xenorhabdus bakwenae TaxID=3026967 RepID=UPI002557DB37|nr:hypothetical protein [Xenorhabdus sp. SF857]WFQ80487.1 hypothetical protein PXH59_04945 [Xenorhabdus sp. SF857]